MKDKIALKLNNPLLPRKLGISPHGGRFEKGVKNKKCIADG
jgi:hypothetical protein